MENTSFLNRLKSLLSQSTVDSLRKNKLALKRLWRPSLGAFKRVKPISSNYGFDRGKPIDRYFIEQFLNTYSSDITGHVLEIQDSTYTQKFGGTHVTKSDVLHLTADNPNATIVADISKAYNIENDTFDCIICTQTLQYIFDIRSAVATLHRIIKPGGVILASVPGISRYDATPWSDCWRLTIQSTTQLFKESFTEENITISSHGNVLTATSFLHGLSSEEIRDKDLAYTDPAYPIVLTIRAVKFA